MNIEEVHIDRHLDALTLYKFVLNNLVDDDNLTVCDRRHLIVDSYTLAHRNSEKEEHETHEEHRDGAKRIRDEGPRYKAHNKICQRCAYQPHQKDCTVTVFMNDHDI
jgi:hypothetical protein